MIFFSVLVEKNVVTPSLTQRAEAAQEMQIFTRAKKDISSLMYCQAKEGMETVMCACLLLKPEFEDNCFLCLHISSLTLSKAVL